MNKIPKLLSIFTMVMFLIIIFQGATHLVPVPKLDGEFEKYERPSFSAQDFASGEYQRLLSRFIGYHYGFSEWTIRLYCQYIWSVYHRSPVRQVAVGKNNYLFEPYFVEDLYESRMYKYTTNPEELIQMFDQQSQRLAKVQAILAEAGVHTLVACIPGKTNIYPEFAPPRDTLTRPLGPRAIEVYPPLFDKYGVNYINLNQWFLDIKDTASYDLFPTLGTHWSNVASTFAFDTMLRYMGHISGQPLRPVVLSHLHEETSPRWPDNDLEKLINPLFHIKVNRPYKYVDVDYAPLPPNVRKPKAIVCGDSFFWNITYNFQLDSLFDYCHYWFYNSTIYFDSLFSSTHDPGFDYVDQLLSTDYLILFYCTGQLYDLGINTTDAAGNIITQALVRLCYDPEIIQAQIQQICQTIRGDANWIARLDRKATDRGLSLDQMVEEDARYLLFTRPEDYFPELAAPGIPTVRCSKFRNR